MIAAPVTKLVGSLIESKMQKSLNFCNVIEILI